MKTQRNTDKEVIEELRVQLFEANCIIDAIKEGAIDALVISKSGQSSIYALESADFTYRILIEKSGEGAVSISAGGLVLYCNECFGNMVGLPVGNIIGTYFNSYIDSVGKFQHLKTALQSGPSKGEMVLNVDGRKLPVYASLTDLNPQVDAIGILITDLTEKRKQEDVLTAYRQQLEAKISNLKRVNFNLEQFIHVITHDIKEPLRKILSISNDLSQCKNKMLDQAEIQKLHIMNGASTRLSAMVDDLSKYALSIHQCDNTEVDLNELVKEVTEDMAMVIEERKAVVTVKSLPLIQGSLIQIRQLFLNLIDNALKYSKEETQPMIRITSEVEDCVDVRRPNKKYYRICLRDNGTGMDIHQVQSILELLQQSLEPVDARSNRIGLAICKRIMENHAGKLEVQSSPEDGSTFNLYFPLQA